MRKNMSSEKMEILVSFFENLERLYSSTLNRDVEEANKLHIIMEDMYDSATSMISDSDHYKLDQRLA